MRSVSRFTQVFSMTLILGCAGTILGSERNYQAIVDRNPFGLKPPVVAPPVDPQANKPPTASNISMTGITSDMEAKKVWLAATVNGKTPPTQYYSLAEGEKQDDIEVLSIDERSETVKVINAGVPVTLTYATHGVKGKAGPASVAAAPGMPAPGTIPPPNAPGGGSPVGGPTVIGKGGVAINHGPTPSAAASFVMTPPGGGAAFGTGGDVNNAGGARVIPTRSLRTQQQQAPSIQPNGEPTLPVEAQYLLMNAQKAEASRRGVNLPPLPPLPGAPGEGAP